MRCCAGDGGLALRSRPAGGGFKPPRAASVKSRGGERRGKVAPVSAAGVSQEGERKQTTDDVSKEIRWHQNRGVFAALGRVWRVPADWPDGARHGGGASLAWAPVRNVGTCRPDTAGGQWSSDPRPVARGRSPSSRPARGCVLTRGTGADRLVVATMPGNAGGAKGAGHLGWLAGQPAPVWLGGAR